MFELIAGLGSSSSSFLSLFFKSNRYSRYNNAAYGLVNKLLQALYHFYGLGGYSNEFGFNLEGDRKPKIQWLEKGWKKKKGVLGGKAKI